jgi:hypothetical protein
MIPYENTRSTKMQTNGMAETQFGRDKKRGKVSDLRLNTGKKTMVMGAEDHVRHCYECKEGVGASHLQQFRGSQQMSAATECRPIVEESTPGGGIYTLSNS